MLEGYLKSNAHLLTYNLNFFILKIIVDSGATKATWGILKNGIEIQRIITPGISPLHSSELKTQQLLDEYLQPYFSKAKSIYFYSTGCSQMQQQTVMYHRLKKVFVAVEYIEVQSDLLAAARALCGNHAGIACILGTGSNSALYDGQEIISNLGGFGYILGDEGSGAVLGKRFLADYLRNTLPERIHQEFFKRFKLTKSDIYQSVYQKPFASRYLAQFVPFIHEHRSNVYIQKLLEAHFIDFFEKNVLIYPESKRLPVSFVGSVAYYFIDEITILTQKMEIELGSLIKDPIGRLLEYHKGSYSVTSEG